MRTANNEGFKCSQLEDWLLFHCLAEGNEIERLQLRLLFLDDNRFQNDSEKALEPSGSGENSGSSYP